MIEITTILTEVKTKESFTIKGNTSLENAGKPLTITVDNRFKSSGPAVNADGSWSVDFVFQQPGDRRLKISVNDEDSETQTIKVVASQLCLRFTNVPNEIRTEKSFTLSGETDGFDDGDQLLLTADGFVLARPLVKDNKWRATVLFHQGGKRMVVLESSEQDRVQIVLDVEADQDLKVVPRSNWLDNNPPVKSLADLPNPKRITIHHFFNPSNPAQTEFEEIQRMRGVRRGQMENPVQRFSDIGYHFVIMSSGRIYEGRPQGKRGAHDVINDGFGVAFDGDYTSRTITQEQFDSAVALCTKLCQQIGITDPTIPVSTPTADFGTINLPRICGHRDRVITGCPGTPGGSTVRLNEIRQAVKSKLS